MALALVLLTAASAVAAPAGAATALSKRITTVLARYGFTGRSVGVYVWDLETGRPVYRRNVHRPYVPASNQKLTVAAAALSLWGASHRFSTAALSTAAPDESGVVRGDVYLKGYGDPTLTTNGLRKLARSLRDAGVRRITGQIVGDEAYFDRKRVVAHWCHDGWRYCGPLGALVVDQGYRGGARVASPAAHAARVFCDALLDVGVRVRRGVATGRAPASALPLVTRKSGPLWRVLARMGKPSDNFIAEMLTKGLGKEHGRGGTTAAGVAVLRSFVLSCGAPPGEVRALDGSGLSYGDRLSPLAVGRLLVTMTRHLDFDSYWGSLAVAGRDGTLRLRMRKTRAQGNVHAKTGTLRISSCLSGYVTTRGREDVAFVILMNGQQLNGSRARAAQDALAVLLAGVDL